MNASHSYPQFSSKASREATRTHDLCRGMDFVSFFLLDSHSNGPEPLT